MRGISWFVEIRSHYPGLDDFLISVCMYMYVNTLLPQPARGVRRQHWLSSAMPVAVSFICWPVLEVLPHQCIKFDYFEGLLIIKTISNAYC